MQFNDKNNSGYILVGDTRSGEHQHEDVYVVRIDGSGNEMWSRSFGDDSHTSYGESAVTTPDGGYLICGRVREFPYTTSNNWDVLLLKVDSNGNEMWKKTCDAGDHEYGQSVTAAPTGGFLVAGHTKLCAGTGESDIYLLRVDSDGNQIWSKSVSYSIYDYGNEIIPSLDDGFVIVGTTTGCLGCESSAYVLKIDSDGNELWAGSYGAELSVGSYDYGNSIAATADGGYILTGNTTPAYTCGSSMYLIKIDDAGNQVFHNVFQGGGFTSGNSVRRAFDNGFIVSGYTLSSQTGYDLYLLKTDEYGQQSWARTFGGVALDSGWSVCETADFGYVAVGATGSFGSGKTDLYVVKTDYYGNPALPGHAPVANAGSDQTGYAGEAVVLDGSGSSDQDGDYPLTFSWEFISKPAGSATTIVGSGSVNPSFIPDVAGDYVAQLIVVDNRGSVSAPDEVFAHVCPDGDRDRICDDDDNCPTDPNTDQADGDHDGRGDVCDLCPLDANNDADGDGVCGDVDNCPTDPNTDQTDGDHDGRGDVCDLCPLDAGNDADGDGVCGDVDNCPTDPNTDQADSDHDGRGDVCDLCPLDAGNDGDGDGVCGDVDNCPTTANPGQTDTDADGIGDACDQCTDVDGDGFAVEPPCGPVDCDDTAAAVNPIAPEICTDGVDNDCDGGVDFQDGECSVTGLIRDLIGIINDPIAFPPDWFKGGSDNRRIPLTNMLESAIALIEAAEAESDPVVQDQLYQQAIAALDAVRQKCDGCYGGNPNNDWVVDCDGQDLIVPKVDLAISLIQARL
ncbi:MAG: thrombospondin type 3 repeat-containing protein [Thermodesulfobacteriota bacterium]